MIEAGLSETFHRQYCPQALGDKLSPCDALLFRPHICLVQQSALYGQGDGFGALANLRATQFAGSGVQGLLGLGQGAAARGGVVVVGDLAVLLFI